MSLLITKHASVAQNCNLGISIMSYFTDIEKAFNTTLRDGLFYKMLLNDINGEIYKVILNVQ